MLFLLVISWLHRSIALLVPWDSENLAIMKNTAFTRSWRGASGDVLTPVGHPLVCRPHHSAMKLVLMAAKRCPPGIDW